MKPSEIREKTPTEQEKLKNSFVEELFHLKVKKATGQLEKVHRLKELRRDLARIYTIESEKLKTK